ncbi:MAG: glycerophosphodiester phosphodiesterase family protein [Gammaproteobacteria bacterium]
MKRLNLPLIIGHRGACGHALENTLAGVHKAKELGVGWIEVDVMLTQDGVPILMHDEQLDRTTQGRGEVGKTPYSIIKNLGVPTLPEFITCLIECQLGANIEMKPYPGQDVETAKIIVHTLQRAWPASLPPPLVSSFSLLSLQAARQADPNLLLGFVMRTWKNTWQTQLQDLYCSSVHVRHTALTLKRVQAIKQAGYYALAYTVNTPQRAHALFTMGIDAVFSDYPDKIFSAARNFSL